MFINASNLKCERGERPVFAGLDFSLAPGEALVVTGPNGSGKSTLLRLIAGLVPRAGGALLCDGAEVAQDWPAFRARLHYVGHLDAIKPALTLSETLAFWVRLHGGRADVLATLDAFGLAPLADLPARLLSVGQRRRLALARLVAVPRTLWLLDEPTTALDAAAQARLAALLAAHRAAGGLVIAATHADLGLEGAERLDLARHATETAEAA
jgi:heme exporter protein A